ncbi:MAG: UvrD-helicase domain-containing protein [Myxococcota bacterium]
MAASTKTQAELASDQAFAAVRDRLDAGDSFLVEAGAGAGKTFLLILALQYLIENRGRELLRNRQRIACVTYTNAARDEILRRTGSHPALFCETIHGFCWSVVSKFQPQLRRLISCEESWRKLAGSDDAFESIEVRYELGHRKLEPGTALLDHDDVPGLMASLTANGKFRRLMRASYPVILIDEYQDTDFRWVEAIKEHMLGSDDSPSFGFFGDHWQKIYGKGCGELSHPAAQVIGVNANFRASPSLIGCLNRMRPELPQYPHYADCDGSVEVISTNMWSRDRKSTAPWTGDLEDSPAHEALEIAKQQLADKGWDFSPERTKILMLTHRVLAREQGYPNLAKAFRYNDSFTQKEHPLVEYVVDTLEPACAAYQNRRFGEMLDAIGGRRGRVFGIEDKSKWTNSMNRLCELRDSGMIGDVIDHLLTTGRPHLSSALQGLVDEAGAAGAAGDEKRRQVIEYERLRDVPYREIAALAMFLDGSSPFQTKHGVKGLEFDNVLVVVGRGWSQYNFVEMLASVANGEPLVSGLDSFTRNRNLFYVSCSRARRRLAILFTQQLSSRAVGTLNCWFGSENVRQL